ncbi:cell division cycle protein 123 like protein [Quercus suber]|uniref:Cell division cycle protein 123 like protein n=1 Tax=Quercus suber TaxID=58331 RepID=A0AAW0JGP9_QUESU
MSGFLWRFDKRSSSKLEKQPSIQFKMKEEEEVNRCQIQEWYPKFKSVSIKIRIHELPESFIQYLLDDSGPVLRK